MTRTKLAILGSHPVTYRIPLYQRVATDPDVHSRVFYGDEYGVRPRKSRWGIENFVWKMPMTEGYEHEFVANRALRPDPSTFFGKLNPGLWASLGRFGPDAMLVSGYYGLYQLQSLTNARITRRKLLYTADTSAPPSRSLKGRLREAWLRALYARVDVVLAPGVRARQHFLDHGVDDSKIVRFPLAVDNETLTIAATTLAPRRQELRARWGVDSHRACVLAVSRLTARKNVGELLRAAADVDDVHVLVVGSGPEENALRALAGELLPGRHTFAGFLNVDEIAEAYVAADVYAMPSSYEPWGLTVNEAMNFGLPLVLSDRVGCAEDAVRVGRTGEIYPLGDHAAFVSALSAVVARARTERDALARLLRDDVEKLSIAAQHRGLREGLRRAGFEIERRTSLD